MTKKPESTGRRVTRRKFLKIGLTAGAAVASFPYISKAATSDTGWYPEAKKSAVVSIARIKNRDVEAAVEEAIDLLGGIDAVTTGKNRILLKPNLVYDSTNDYSTTNPRVVKTLAGLMKSAGKQVVIGEGSASAMGHNIRKGVIYRTRRMDILEPLQWAVYDKTGYKAMADEAGVPLVNLHTEDVTEAPVVPSGFVFDKIKMPASVMNADLVCSVPIMKTHAYTTVTLAMKNLFGLYTGRAYGTVRGWVHDQAQKVGIDPTATNIAVMDMLSALRGMDKLGLSVVDAYYAMDGNGPSMGNRRKMNLIIAGTNLLAVDRVCCYLMGFDQAEVPTLAWADKIKLGPATLEEIEVRGVNPREAQAKFARPVVAPYSTFGKDMARNDQMPSITYA